VRPLHAIVEHKWNPRNVATFFLMLGYCLVGLFSWMLTFVRATPNTDNPTGVMTGLVMLSMAVLIGSGIKLWQWEERQPVKKSKEEYIAQLEKELGIK
jgi:hypothetical protein